ncbi:MAG: hypothetical protein U1C04_06930 [Hydrogenophaga sp.]|uniref:hypothetical protein n=1 Tax=Hydrogenophaga sp. TaxID=1904254 RepID=UPI002AB9C728|nr:hypothetical protein [Hydrogenophaga sp.]MDZ4280489.1 hypothetical protein [Hydrogenophaga sp.]
MPAIGHGAAGDSAGLTTVGLTKIDEILYDFVRCRLRIVVAEVAGALTAMWLNSCLGRAPPPSETTALQSLGLKARRLQRIGTANPGYVGAVVGAAPEEWRMIYDRSASQSRYSLKCQLPKRTAASWQSAQARQAKLNGRNRCIGAPQDTASPAAVGHLRVGVWVAANPMDSNVEPVLISAM